MAIMIVLEDEPYRLITDGDEHYAVIEARTGSSTRWIAMTGMRRPTLQMVSLPSSETTGASKAWPWNATNT